MNHNLRFFPPYLSYGNKNRNNGRRQKEVKKFKGELEMQKTRKEHLKKNSEFFPQYYDEELSEW